MVVVGRGGVAVIRVAVAVAWSGGAAEVGVSAGWWGSGRSGDGEAFGTRPEKSAEKFSGGDGWPETGGRERETFNMCLTAANLNLSPLPTNLKLSLDKGSPLPDPATYRRLVGRLLYLTMTRPDISYVVQHLSQFVSSPKDVYLQAAIHLLKYLKGSISKGIFFTVQPYLKKTGFSDADYASCLMTRKSLTGYCIFLGHSLVSWKTKKQAIVSRSSTEAEYRNIATTTCELLWLSFLLKDLHIPVKLPITLFCDNKSAQQIVANPCFHDRTKHMDIDCHFTREKVEDGFLQTAFIPSHLQLADIMTKALNSVQHSFLAGKSGVSTAPT
ncbi:RNA-directed DNA polymerase [Tanacetum coccineum]